MKLFEVRSNFTGEVTSKHYYCENGETIPENRINELRSFHLMFNGGIFTMAVGESERFTSSTFITRTE